MACIISLKGFALIITWILNSEYPTIRERNSDRIYVDEREILIDFLLDE